MRRLLALLRSHDDDRGVALAAVLGIGMVVMILAATMVGISTSGAVKTTSDRDYANAMAAAYAGLADYQSRVNGDNTYATKYGDSTQPFSSGDTFANKTGGNPAFTSWVTVPDSNGASGSTSYRYAVDNSIYGQQGIVRVQVTGRAGTTTRTLVANVKPDGFSNYLYWTDYESGDPDITGENCNNVYQNATFTAPSIGGKPVCSRIQFQDGDSLDGPIRSNDVMLICGGTFKNTVQSARRDDGLRLLAAADTGVPVLQGLPARGRRLLHPAVDDQRRAGPDVLRRQRGDRDDTRHGLSVQRPDADHLQRRRDDEGALAPDARHEPPEDGPVRLRAVEVRRDLRSAGRRRDRQHEPAREQPRLRAGRTGDGRGRQLRQPELLLVEVHREDGPVGVHAQFVGGGQRPRVPLHRSRRGVQRDVHGDHPAERAGRPRPLQQGVRLQQRRPLRLGKVDSSITLVAENYVYVTGDLTYTANRAASTVLGIVGQEAVLIWNPMFDRVTSLFGSTTTTPFLADDRTVSGAILSNQAPSPCRTTPTAAPGAPSR